MGNIFLVSRTFPGLKLTLSLLGQRERIRSCLARYIRHLTEISIIYRENCVDYIMFEMIKNPDLLELIFRYLDPASVKTVSR